MFKKIWRKVRLTFSRGYRKYSNVRAIEYGLFSALKVYELAIKMNDEGKIKMSRHQLQWLLDYYKKQLLNISPEFGDLCKRYNFDSSISDDVYVVMVKNFIRDLDVVAKKYSGLK